MKTETYLERGQIITDQSFNTTLAYEKRNSIRAKTLNYAARMSSNQSNSTNPCSPATPLRLFIYSSENLNIDRTVHSYLILVCLCDNIFLHPHVLVLLLEAIDSRKYLNVIFLLQIKTLETGRVREHARNKDR